MEIYLIIHYSQLSGYILTRGKYEHTVSGWQVIFRIWLPGSKFSISSCGKAYPEL